MALVTGDPVAVGVAWVLRGTVLRSTQAAWFGQSQGEFTMVGGTSGCRSPTSGA
jgi:hypothetical protein